MQFKVLMLGTALAATFVLSGQAPALAKDKTTISFWTFLSTEGTDPRSAVLKQIVDGFNTSQDTYEVKVDSIPFARYDSQVIQATAAGQGPDVLNVYSDNLAMHVDAGTLQPLTPYRDMLPDDFVTDLKFFVLKGELMAVPWDTRTWLLWYRDDLLAAKGLAVPKTLDEMARDGQAISTDGLMGFGIGAGSAANGVGVTEAFIPILWGAGGDVFDDTGKAIFNSDAGVKTLTFMRDLVTRYGAMNKSAISMGLEDMFTAYRAGTVGMTIMGSFRVSGGRNSDATGDRLQTAPIPGFSADAPSPARLASQTLALGADAKNQEGAVAFIDYYLNNQAQLGFARANVLPSRQSSYDLPELAANAELQQWKQYVHDYGRFEPTPVDFPQLSETIAKALQQTIVQGIDPKAALDEAVATYNKAHQY
ncbi:sugar ABC transporter substrate-binding protein [Martelella sp. HB161492]|uniref:ABC transporter substrate-binding protein n=1 Tax=Martelella sp. HB161492 TaxID=2720726 RepID=UPI00159271DD|nr:sugar ABC transporter substrate-binding protein [Martelella sp. HB161492]